VDWPPLEAKKNTEIPPATPIPPQNHSTGLSTPFQLNSKPNSSPQHTIQSSESKKANHPESVIMLPGPTTDTFETRAECRANKLNLTRGREGTVLDKPGTLLHGPLERFLSRPPTEHWCDKPIKATTRRVNKFWKKCFVHTGNLNLIVGLWHLDYSKLKYKSQHTKT